MYGEYKNPIPVDNEDVELARLRTELEKANHGGLTDEQKHKARDIIVKWVQFYAIHGLDAQKLANDSILCHHIVDDINAALAPAASGEKDHLQGEPK